MASKLFFNKELLFMFLSLYFIENVISFSLNEIYLNGKNENSTYIANLLKNFSFYNSNIKNSTTSNSNLKFLVDKSDIFSSRKMREFDNNLILFKIFNDYNFNISNIIYNNDRNLQEQIFRNPYDPKFGQAENISCDSKTNCLYPNRCIFLNTICNCSIEYANFFNNEEVQFMNDSLVTGYKPIYCKYERKKQLTAFIITIFFNFGVAQFYIRNYSVGFIKLAIAMFSIIFLPFAVCYKKVLLSMLVGLFFCFIISIWGLVDLILFGINYYNDGNDIPLKPW